MTLKYLAMPYTKFPGGPVAAFEAAARLTAKLLNERHLVYSPIVHTHPIAMVGGIDPFNHDIWLPFDEAMMEAADELYVAKLPGWEESYGVAHEIKRFKEMGKPVTFIDPDTLEVTE